MSDDQIWLIVLSLALAGNTWIWGRTSGEGKTRPLSVVATILLLVAITVRVAALA